MRFTDISVRLMKGFILLAGVNQYAASLPASQNQEKHISPDVESFLQHDGCQLQDKSLLNLLLQPLGFSVTSEGYKSNQNCARPYPKFEHVSVTDPPGELCALAFSTLKEACNINAGGGRVIDPVQVSSPREETSLGDLCATLSNWVKGLESAQDRSLYGEQCHATCAEHAGTSTSIANEGCYGLYRGRRLLQALKEHMAQETANSAGTQENDAPEAGQDVPQKLASSAANAGGTQENGALEAGQVARLKPASSAANAANSGGSEENDAPEAGQDVPQKLASSAANTASPATSAPTSAPATAATNASNASNADVGPHLRGAASPDKSGAPESVAARPGPDGDSKGGSMAQLSGFLPPVSATRARFPGSPLPSELGGTQENDAPDAGQDARLKPASSAAIAGGTQENGALEAGQDARLKPASSAANAGGTQKNGAPEAGQDVPQKLASSAANAGGAAGPGPAAGVTPGPSKVTPGPSKVSQGPSEVIAGPPGVIAGPPGAVPSPMSLSSAGEGLPPPPLKGPTPLPPAMGQKNQRVLSGVAPGHGAPALPAGFMSSLPGKSADPAPAQNPVPAALSSQSVHGTGSGVENQPDAPAQILPQPAAIKDSEAKEAEIAAPNSAAGSQESGAGAGAGGSQGQEGAAAASMEKDDAVKSGPAAADEEEAVEGGATVEKTPAAAGEAPPLTDRLPESADDPPADQPAPSEKKPEPASDGDSAPPEKKPEPASGGDPAPPKKEPEPASDGDTAQEAPPAAPEQDPVDVDSPKTAAGGDDSDITLNEPPPEVYKAQSGARPVDQQPGLPYAEGGTLPTQGGDSNFFAYFLTAVVLCIVLYLAFHNKQKILALVIEGGRPTGRRRPHSSQYRRLDNSLEEAISSEKRREVASSIVY